MLALLSTHTTIWYARFCGAALSNKTVGLGFGVWGLGFGVWGLGFGVWGSERMLYKPAQPNPIASKAACDIGNNLTHIDTLARLVIPVHLAGEGGFCCGIRKGNWC